MMIKKPDARVLTVSVVAVVLVVTTAAVGSMTLMGGVPTGIDSHASPPLQTAMALPAPQDLTLPGQYIYLNDAVLEYLGNNTATTTALFDADDGHAVIDLLIPNIGTWLHQDVTPLFTDAPLALRYSTLLFNAGYDATAPYDEKAVGVYSRIANLPASESENSRNINIASIYAVYRLTLEFDPERETQWRSMLAINGLDPDDSSGLGLDCARSHELTSPVAIGNLAAKCVLEGRQHDGFNHFGDETPGYPFRDTTGYAPANPANALVDPSRWQPLVTRIGTGEYAGQQFITPQWANTEPYSGVDPRSIRADAPTKSNHENAQQYKEQADEVLAAVAALDDRKKILAEYFDNKARASLFFPAVEEIQDTKGFWQLGFLIHMAQFDAGIVAWQEKARYDAVRPITAIHHIYGDSMVPTYDKKDGSPRTVPASQWEPYMNTGNHPEYPSASACFCAAQAEAWKQYYGGADEIPDIDGRQGFRGVIPTGSSAREPYVTPSSPVVIQYETWSEFVRECGESRIWSGLHFRSAVDASVAMCTGIGNHAYDYFQTLLDGIAEPRTPAAKLSPDPLLDQPHFTGR